MGALQKVMRAGVTGFAALTLLWAAPAGAADGYTLSRYDRVRLMILEWDLDDLRSPINGEFTVGADGMIAVPLIGRIEGVGQTLETVADEISAKLKERLGLQAAPVASLEVINYGPIYVVGDVRAPGQIAYQPGLSVLHALALAGGPTQQVQSAAEAERQAISAELELQQLGLQRADLISKLNRLEVEAGDTQGDAKARAVSIAADDQSGGAILAARRNMVEISRNAFDAIKELSGEEVVTLEQYLGAVRRQQEVLRGQIGVVSTLRDKGLGSASREAELERSLSDLESKEQDVLARIVRAKQDAVRLGEQQEQSQRQREVEILTELQATTLQLHDIDARITASRELAARIGTPSSMQNLQYVVTRFDQKTNEPSTIPVDQVAQLLSGDILEVRSAAKPADQAKLDQAAPSSADQAVSSQ